MLAQVPHVLLAAHAGTIMGVETNGMQFYPEASRLEDAVHPGFTAGATARWICPPYGDQASAIAGRDQPGIAGESRKLCEVAWASRP